MLRVACALLFGLVTSARWSPAQPILQAAPQLAARISSLLPRHQTGSLELANQSTLAASEWLSFRSQVEAELRKSGVTVGPAGEPSVRITLAESAHGWLFVAEIGSGDARQVALLPWNPPALSLERPRITLTKRPIWTQAEPILDVLLVDSSNQMLVLSPSKIASFRLSAGAWTPVTSVSLVLPRPMPRDPRGRLESTPTGFRAFIPGTTCSGSLQPDLSVTCSAGNEAWPVEKVRWVTDRNLLETDGVVGSFFTIAHAPEGWGSDIAPNESACGSLLIATSTSTDRDTVRAYQNSTPVSDALSLPGPVTALWPSETRGETTLVVHNLQTGEYEASRLGLACAQ
jgi:hypothetical protein